MKQSRSNAHQVQPLIPLPMTMPNAIYMSMRGIHPNANTAMQQNQQQSHDGICPNVNTTMTGNERELTSLDIFTPEDYEQYKNSSK